MNKTRLEAFSDGVLAIIITIMVLEIKVPHEPTVDALCGLAPVFLSYTISFAYIGIYWNNHHHLLHTVKKLSPSIMWSNLNLLFWLSLVPFSTAWMGENNFKTIPVAVYSTMLLICGIAYDILRRNIMAEYRDDSVLKHALLKQKAKALISTACYLAAIPLAFLHTAISISLFVFVAIIWFIPSKEIEQGLEEKS